MERKKKAKEKKGEIDSKAKPSRRDSIHARVGTSCTDIFHATGGNSCHWEEYHLAQNCRSLSL